MNQNNNQNWSNSSKTSVAAVLLLVAGPASAFEDMLAQPGTVHGSVGLAVGVKPEYAGAKDSETRLMPHVSLYYGQTLFLTGMTAGANLFRQRTTQGIAITAGPLLALRGGRQEDDNAALNGLGDIDRGLDAGAFVRLRKGQWQLRADVRADVSAGDGGTTVNISAGRGWHVDEKLHVRAILDATWASSDHMNTFFGIDAVQAANSGLSQYQADAGIKSVGVNLMADRAINSEWTGFAALRYTRLIGDAADSPIVADLGSRNQVAVTAGIKYRF